MIAAISLDQLASVSAARMLNSVAEGIAIGAFAWILLQLAGRRNSSTRFAVWFSALLAIALIPWLGLAHPAPNGADPASSAITLPASWARVGFAAWAIIAAAALARVGLGLWQLRKLRASCIAIDPATLDPLLRTTLQQFQAIRSVELRQSDRLRVPTAIGFLKPLVVIPTWAMTDLSTAELHSILIHELAHLRRWDDWTNLAQQILKSLLFFHPAVWWIENKLALEREMACDDAVLAQTANPKAYAQCLVSMAEKSFMRRTLAMAQAAVNRVQQTSLRVAQILDVNRPRATSVWRPALYSVAAFSLACFVALPHAPEFVAFEDRTPAIASATAPIGLPLPSDSSLHVVTQVRAKISASKPASAPKTILASAESKRLSISPTEARFDQTDTTADPVPQTTLAQVDFIEERQVAFVADNPAPPAILLVTHTDEYGNVSQMIYQVSVWRLVVLDVTPSPAETRIPAKQI